MGYLCCHAKIETKHCSPWYVINTTPSSIFFNRITLDPNSSRGILKNIEQGIAILYCCYIVILLLKIILPVLSLMFSGYAFDGD
jgi:hypothetical protein